MSNETDAIRETVAEWLRFNADRIVSGEYVDDLPDGVESNGGEPDGPQPDPSADLDHGLAWEAITALALAERLAMDFGHRFVGKRMLHELAEVRHRIEDHIGVDGKLSDGIVAHAGERYAAWQEGREEVEL